VRRLQFSQSRNSPPIINTVGPLPCSQKKPIHIKEHVIYRRCKRIFCNLSFYLRQLRGVQLKIESRRMAIKGLTFPHTYVTCNNTTHRMSVRVLQMISPSSHTCLSPGEQIINTFGSSSLETVDMHNMQI
jgi:hypothetical protein